ncbi:hypothetical protein JAAARDRAFT_63376 [Jaapia argillacea MUCL 33604]|uniref:Uncharacterized protein n=1 Tax=Jaapia argillacea MUCL 33604 TaxID=933084 RepID=A0A067PGE3_9AGAM|nr:hypothetical protein JAAARDRAFT_63376 [Jaapia argillacea MUCL 33604]
MAHSDARAHCQEETTTTVVASMFEFKEYLEVESDPASDMATLGDDDEEEDDEPHIPCGAPPRSIFRISQFWTRFSFGFTRGSPIAHEISEKPLPFHCSTTIHEPPSPRLIAQPCPEGDHEITAVPIITSISPPSLSFSSPSSSLSTPSASSSSSSSYSKSTSTPPSSQAQSQSSSKNLSPLRNAAARTSSSTLATVSTSSHVPSRTSRMAPKSGWIDWLPSLDAALLQLYEPSSVRQPLLPSTSTEVKELEDPDQRLTYPLSLDIPVVIPLILQENLIKELTKDESENEPDLTSK